MKQNATWFAGILAAGLLATGPAWSQGQQPAGQGQAGSKGQSSQSQSSQGTAGQRQSGQDQTHTGAQTGHNPVGSANRMGAADSTFAHKAAVGGMAEVKLGQLATEKASNADVKSFGQMMVDDHGKANDELKQLASSKGITLPTDIDAKHQATYDRLSKLSGAEFDRAYMQEMLKDHREDVNEFRKESNSGADAELKAWAGKTLPTLEKHLQTAESTSAKVKK